MKKSMKRMLVSALVITLAFSSGCAKASVSDSSETDITVIYNAYVAYTEKNNGEPLSYEKWLESIKGADGKDGVDGKSAYDLYKQAYPDYTGTYVEWLASLKGEKGDKGADGRGIKSITYESGVFTITYTDGTSEKVNEINKSEGTEGLEYYFLPDGTFGVKAGKALYLESIIVPKTYKGKTVSEVLDSAFAGARGLKSVKLPDSIKKIGNDAFSGCVALENLNVPSSVNYIGSYAFYGIKNALFEQEDAWKKAIKPYVEYTYCYYSSNSGSPDSKTTKYATDEFSLIKILSSGVSVKTKGYGKMLQEAGKKDEYVSLKIYEKSLSKQ